jgi:hypothetical protein
MHPPQHHIDASPILVLSSSENWDLDRVLAELEGLTEEEKARHPYRVYRSGDSRYSLTAKHTWEGGTNSPQEYLKPGAVQFHLRRHRLDHMAEVQDAFDREIKSDGPAAMLSVWLKSARYGVSKIVGADDIEWSGAGNVPEHILRNIMDHHGGLPAISDVGAAAWMISRPLSEAEKKP